MLHARSVKEVTSYFLYGTFNYYKSLQQAPPTWCTPKISQLQKLPWSRRHSNICTLKHTSKLRTKTSTLLKIDFPTTIKWIRFVSIIYGFNLKILNFLLIQFSDSQINLWTIRICNRITWEVSSFHIRKKCQHYTTFFTMCVNLKFNYTSYNRCSSEASSKTISLKASLFFLLNISSKSLAPKL